jgi:hypothetical protein
MKTMKKMLSLGLALVLVLMLCLLPYSAYGEGETAPVGEGSDVQTDEPAEKRVPSGPLAKQVPRRPAAPSAYAQGETSSEEKGDKPAEKHMPSGPLAKQVPRRPQARSNYATNPTAPEYTCRHEIFVLHAAGHNNGEHHVHVSCQQCGWVRTEMDYNCPGKTRCMYPC